jgi:Uma2 family endonuclease
MDGREEMATPSVRKLTYDDFLLFPEDDGLRHELIDGEHYVTAAPATVHQRLVRELLVALHTHLQLTESGEVFAAPFDVVLSHHDVVEPDLVVVLSHQAGIITEKHVKGAPALVIEILSPGTRRRDVGIKSRAYERWGVSEYWTVDPDQQSVMVRRRDASGAFIAAGTFAASAGHGLMSPQLPGFVLPLPALFARANPR